MSNPHFSAKIPESNSKNGCNEKERLGRNYWSVLSAIIALLKTADN